MKKIGFLTSGGDCQSLNATMRGVAKTLYQTYPDVEIYGILDIDDSAGATSVMGIRIYESDDNILNEIIEYVNGEAEYNSEQTSYMSVIMDSYNDSCADNIKSEIEKFIVKQREDEDIMDYVERKRAEEDWKAEAADVLEDK